MLLLFDIHPLRKVVRFGGKLQGGRGMGGGGKVGDRGGGRGSDLGTCGAKYILRSPESIFLSISCDSMYSMLGICSPA